MRIRHASVGRTGEGRRLRLNCFPLPRPPSIIPAQAGIQGARECRRGVWQEGPHERGAQRGDVPLLGAWECPPQHEEWVGGKSYTRQNIGLRKGLACAERRVRRTKEKKIISQEVVLRLRKQATAMKTLSVNPLLSSTSGYFFTRKLIENQELSIRNLIEKS